MATNLSRQYLRAMGIDCWQFRDTQAAVVTEPEGVQAVAPVEASLPRNPQQNVKPELKIAQQTLTTLDESLRSSIVVVVNNAADGKLLLVLERELTSAAEDLLSAMLKAISIDRLSQATAMLTPSAEGESINAVCDRVEPGIVVVMSLLTDSANIAELDSHRHALQRFSWLSVPVAITLHPQVLLENPQAKRAAWEDLKRVKAFLDG